MNYKLKVERIVEYYEKRCGLTDWESHFIDSIYKKIENLDEIETHAFLSEKQMFYIDKIYNKA